MPTHGQIVTFTGYAALIAALVVAFLLFRGRGSALVPSEAAPELPASAFFDGSSAMFFGVPVAPNRDADAAATAAVSGCGCWG